MGAAFASDIVELDEHGVSRLDRHAKRVRKRWVRSSAQERPRSRACGKAGSSVRCAPYVPFCMHC